ncbi:DUF6350 family protein [Gordonia sp. (in: high G+C Gram-positive bacteria)]|uniref:cell division protein PerM n=1 Tax=Gordonia sp. (in: high G+C Gram-positive bacteria) TaxID=84139 RepID=UPI003C75E216
MSAPSTENLATRLRQVRLAKRVDTAPKPPVTWHVIKVALTVPTIAWLAIAVVVLIVKLAAGDGFSGIGAVTAAGWLAVTQTSLMIGGVTIGVLPLVPTLLVGYGTYRVVKRATAESGSFNELLSIAGTAVAGPLLATALALAVVADGASASAIGNPNALAAFGTTILVHGVAAMCGLLPRVVQPFLEEFAIPASDRVGARGGAAAFAVLIVGGALAVFFGYLTHFGAIGDLIADGNTFDGYLGLTGLSILYLPNMVIGAAAMTVGASATFGGTVLDSFSTYVGAVPPLPVAGVVPTNDLGAAGALMFAAPIAAGILLGWYTRSDNVKAHFRAIGVGAALASGLMVVVTAVSGGTLGEIGKVGVSIPVAGVFTFTSVGVTAALVAGVLWLVGRRGTPVQVEVDGSDEAELDEPFFDEDDDFEQIAESDVEVDELDVEDEFAEEDAEEAEGASPSAPADDK